MRNYVEEIRASPPKVRRAVAVLGFDPGVGVLGYALLTAEIGGSHPPAFDSAHLHQATFAGLTGEKPQKGHHQAFQIIQKITEHSPLVLAMVKSSVVVIEGQNFYPRTEDSRAKMVATANALIMIAHVSGAVNTMARVRGKSVHVVLPNEWKGTRSKSADHLRTAVELSGCVTELGNRGDMFTMSERRITEISAKWEHSLDALGMALYGVTQLHRGVWRE
jgi:Holliday junction resolvasome RuvABC endonuclease subunit